MRLRIVTPLAVIVDEEGVLAIRAEDSSGCFGVLPRHADFITSLAISVVSWTSADSRRHFCAVRRGVFSAAGGCEVSLATREAVAGDDLSVLDQSVLARFRDEVEAERFERVGGTKLQLAAIRQIMRHLRPEGRGAFE